MSDERVIESAIPCPRCKCKKALLTLDKNRFLWMMELMYSAECLTCGLGKIINYGAKNEGKKLIDSTLRLMYRKWFEYRDELHKSIDFDMSIRSSAIKVLPTGKKGKRA